MLLHNKLSKHSSLIDLDEQLNSINKDQSINSSMISEFENNMKNQFLLESTKITFSIVSKFYMQWFMLIFVHLIVFWYFPIEGNMKL